MPPFLPLCGVSAPAISGNGLVDTQAVRAMCIDPSTGNIYVGGSFSTASGQSRSGLAAFTRNGVLLSWAPVVQVTFPSTGIGTISAMLWTAAGIYVAGDFAQINGTARSNAALISTAGVVQSWNPGPDGRVYALATDGTSIYLGGQFSHLYGTSRTWLGAATQTGAGTLVSGFTPSLDGQVNAIVIDSGHCYAGGSFAFASGNSRPGVAQLSASTGAATTWNANLSSGADVLSLAVDTSHNLYLAGGFTTCLGTATPNGFAAVSGSTPTLNAWTPVPGAGPSHNGSACLVVANGTDVYWFQNGIAFTAPTYPVSGCMDASGTDHAWDLAAAIEANPGIYAAAVDASNPIVPALWVGGAFFSISATNPSVLTQSARADERQCLAKVADRTVSPTALAY